MSTQLVSTQADPDPLELLVRQIRFEGQGIHSYELVDPEGAALPPFTAGAHIDIHLAGVVVRQYSISNAPRERHRYVIAVLRDERGRCGSRALHEQLRVQDIVRVSRPRNNFRLVDGARRVLLIAGGIGVTPLKTMAHELEEAGVEYEMHYCAKDARCAAFAEEFAPMRASGRLHFHFDGGDPSADLDIRGLLNQPRDGEHVYYCSPGGFMKACAEAAEHWPAGTVYFEHFKALERSPAGQAANDALDHFIVRIASTGQEIEIAKEQTIADALVQAGVAMETSCCAGLCGTCKVRYLEGEVEHNDFILSDEEKTEYLTACVSRAASKVFVLDL
ncbi:Flavodoxin reductases (ferredoxin-NADPH reductases) family 1, Vanillate O-demethylase oxidoreductase [Candidatus Paraburkholderia kirkii UZHbot1]|uniref:Flavodoxin reductases (Ferredoxin-NADPH reductases) family 1, Vanillate O-demethylase oxidoreductase n=1 Tax=Candidatus Paraburkholderia kirkii UZHbot1 TaxID=1055526 RepID=G4MHM6_9BURK|nr:Flavodoxin reductases (ferredoxin-NADPH reductases) family 1, Vanillate O-demethylase oxidoreductase [Candidatus Paraburkholderia kirkii UZHbot1]